MDLNPPFQTPQVSSQATRTSLRVTDDALPSHWKNDFKTRYRSWIGRMLQGLFSTLCIVSVGRQSLDHTWRELRGGEEKSKAHMDRIIYRLTSMTTMVGLLLASLAALITTEAPKARTVDYTMRGSLICLWTSFGLLLGAAVVGSSAVYVISICTPEWLVLMASRQGVICVLITLFYPFLAVGVSTLLCVFGALSGLGGPASTPVTWA
ncbi:hypothetical protein AURDEDRAFT_170413 [Auricularia subglabra TFB-10046 SS5]|nr:hypothetical protein AURDEDRAFT_170413 [Auricularia subglabra TFB-10046 SS5]